MEKRTVSVLVVTYDSGEEIEHCLDAALAQDVPGWDLEVVVVDNASSDDTLQKLAAYGERITVLPRDENVGYAKGVNLAAAASNGEIVLLLNPDCVMDPGCVAALVDHLHDAPGVGVAAALLRYPDGRPQLFARRELSLGQVLWGLTDFGRRADRAWRGGRGLASRQYADVFEAGVDKPVEVDCPAAACVAVWRHLVRGRVFSEAFPLVFNDADLYRRLRTKGYRAEVVPAATAVHGQGTALKRVPSPRMRAEFVASLRRYANGQFGLHKLVALWVLLAVDAVTSTAMSYLGPPNERTKARNHAKGTLGGLGAPGGATPWLTPVARMRPRPRAQARLAKNELRPGLRALNRWLRCKWFVVRLRCGAWLVQARLTTDIDPSADLARSVLLEIQPRSRVHVVIGERARIQPRVHLRLGGTLIVGPYSELRVGVGINVNGTLELAGRNVLGRGTMVHADGHQVWEWGASASEYVGVSDSNHAIDGSPVHLWDQPVAVADVRLGAACFLAGHAVVTAGTTVGAGSVIGANGVVTKDIPPGVLAVGAPARVVAQLSPS